MISEWWWGFLCGLMVATLVLTFLAGRDSRRRHDSNA